MFKNMKGLKKIIGYGEFFPYSTRTRSSVLTDSHDVRMTLLGFHLERLTGPKLDYDVLFFLTDLISINSSHPAVRSIIAFRKHASPPTENVTVM